MTRKAGISGALAILVVVIVIGYLVVDQGGADGSPPVAEPLWERGASPFDTFQTGRGVLLRLPNDPDAEHSGELIDIESGDTLWTVDSESTGLTLTGDLLLTEQAETVTAFDAVSGDERFRVEEDAHTVERWYTAENRLVVTTSDSTKNGRLELAAYELDTGERLWRRDTSVLESRALVVPSTGGALFTVAGHGRGPRGEPISTWEVTEFDPATGDEVGDVPPPDGFDPEAVRSSQDITAVGSVVVFPVYDNENRCPVAAHVWDSATRRATTLTVDTPAASDCPGSHVDGTRLATVAANGHPVVYDVTTGRLVWESSVPGTIGGFVDGVLHLDDDDGGWLVDFETDRRFDTGEPMVALAAGVDDVIVLTTHERVKALDRATGDTRWQSPGRAVAVVGGVVLVVTDDGPTRLSAVPV
ncbi:PQQ-binding-like beta-propeller repeat protein [Stackebrandtia soli]|uniref:outer membrane protein assembly factor BamB family protein n=1 Tax=Stackebrandtia soli TaxID=1892856 RepID=UPI0039ED5792